ncbi:MAG: J domain-containing protein [Deltaproteobacteria bacterium]|nr:J domain-containing protein [Deltaproteobacteria bacterium]
MDEEQLKARIGQIHADLEDYTYYELLNLDPAASPDDVQAAFHRMALSMHPDRYQTHADGELRRQIYAIYKRVAEAYRVLMDPESRKAYGEALGRGEKRLAQVERQRTGPKRAEDTIDHPQGRKYFLMGQEAERRGDKKTARLHYKFAKDLVGDHPTVLARLAALDAAEKK